MEPKLQFTEISFRFEGSEVLVCVSAKGPIPSEDQRKAHFSGAKTPAFPFPGWESHLLAVLARMILEDNEPSR